MVKILMFMPHLNMRSRFEEAIDKLASGEEDIKIELIHVFGTPDSLSSNRDAEIMVARGMTYERLHKLLPEKHMVELKLTSFDIVDALIRAKQLAPKRIALCLHKQQFASIENLEVLCNAKIDYYDVLDEESGKKAIEEILRRNTDAVVGAGTICGLCDECNIPRIHIETKDNAIEEALTEAIKAAKSINNERAKADMIRTILNNNEDAILAINESGRILAVNNQAYKTYQLSTQDSYVNRSIEAVSKELNWRHAMLFGKETAELLKINGKNYYIQYKPIMVDSQGAGTIIITKNTEKIMETETKIRRSLSEKGLTSKYTFEDIIGSSQAIQENLAMARRYSGVDSNVLIIGETGTGKELFAHSIHSASRRSNEPFVALNCAALPENLLESELFGYESGAFSGASKNGKIGLFELAHKGTIFLDEIGEIPIALQAKLLRVLQEKEIRRIGGDRVQPVDVRVISATNVNIDKQIEEGNFRSDLYYRLNLLDINIPPLRERQEDIMPMVDTFLSKFACEVGKAAPKITPKAKYLLENYAWPGNVRQLRNICERLTVLNDGGEIGEDEVKQLKIFKKTEEPRSVQMSPELVEQLAKQIVEQAGPKMLQQIFPEGLSQTASLASGKKKKDLAEELGVSRTTLWRMAKKQEELEKKKQKE